MEQFHKYLYGNTFVIHMDTNLLTYFLTSGKLDATAHPWLAGFENYNFALNYWSGKVNVDALSHLLREEHDQHNQHIEADTVCALMSHAVQGVPP